ncbi:hypothetical protein F5B22DRAFT_587822 [Xylaria bambusicola]|uniref:uncharacterized protein n=1 Tax=Xylaria bambusicola TaxID=326684 RepID=UPI0020081C74|nr:uncharacterized protein F5B22DRAFT_587822 [Xylaria bambusicola]KAI0525805.1 hypothetical protein F5B22DRAFT_587822 [Xylaria bambusicola]
MDSLRKKPQRGPKRKNYMKAQKGFQIDCKIINNKPVPKNVEPCTERDYARQLQNWDDFNSEFGPRTVESLEDLKEFMSRLGYAMREGMEPDETLSWQGIRSYWKKFTAGYRRERGEISAEHVLSISRLIEPKGELGKLLNIVPDHGPRKHATAATFIWVGEYLWGHDWKIFSRPRLRVDLWACLSLAAYTSARVSDYLESSARGGSEVGLYYRDTTLIVFQNERNDPEFALQVTKKLKGHHPLSSKLPTPDIHEGGVSERRPLYMNPMLFFLAIFYARGALRDYRGAQGLSRLLDLKVPPGQKQILIHWHQSVLNQPVFSGPSGKILTAGAFTKELRPAEIRAGFPDPPSLHDYRAEGLTNVDSNPLYSDTRRQRFAGHENNKMQQQHYASRNPGIDSQAAYLGMQARGVNVGECFRQLEVRWEPALWQSLPAAKQEELTRSKEYQGILAQISAISAVKRGRRSRERLGTAKLSFEEKDLSSDDAFGVLAHPDRKLRRDLAAMQRKALSKLWKEKSTQAQVGSRTYTCRGVDHPFSRLRPILPLRRQLADFLLTDASLRSPIGRAALDALINLYNSKTEVDRYGLDPSQCPCPMPNPSQLHVYDCRKRNCPSAEFCFLCNEWFSDPEAWEQHCRHHLEHDPLPVELAWQRIESTFLPGYCPFCLWDPYLGAASRLHPFCSRDSWENHIRSHGVEWLARCPDKRCAEPCDDAQTFSYHMYDVHRIPLGVCEASRGRLKRELSAEFESSSDTKRIKIEEGQVLKTEFVFEYHTGLVGCTKHVPV